MFKNPLPPEKTCWLDSTGEEKEWGEVLGQCVLNAVHICMRFVSVCWCSNTGWLVSNGIYEPISSLHPCVRDLLRPWIKGKPHRQYHFHFVV